jgi:CubicO group peptidase (beta-lactamase class C family)
MRAMRPHLPTALLALLPAPLLALAACGEEPAQQPQAETPQAALAAVSQDPGVSRAELARRVDALFTSPDAAETRAVIVMHDGKIAAERYADGYSEETRFVSWSMAKTVTAVMIGMLVADGKLKLDETPPIPAWQRPGDPRGAITLRQLLQMRSGLRHTESGDPAYDADTVRMLFLAGRDDMASWAEAPPLEAQPGTMYEYSSATTVILADIAARVLSRSSDPDARRTAVDEFLKARLFTPLGMYSMVPEYDAAGTLIGGSLIHGTARDWARFGEFLRNEGAVKGVQLVPRSWVEFMIRPSPRSADYGGQTWLNRPSGTEQDALFADRGPADLFAAIGHLGQYILVSPGRKLTVVRLGKTDDPLRGPLVDRLADVVALYPSE